MLNIRNEEPLCLCLLFPFILSSLMTSSHEQPEIFLSFRYALYLISVVFKSRLTAGG